MHDNGNVIVLGLPKSHLVRTPTDIIYNLIPFAQVPNDLMILKSKTAVYCLQFAAMWFNQVISSEITNFFMHMDGRLQACLLVYSFLEHPLPITSCTCRSLQSLLSVD